MNGRASLSVVAFAAWMSGCAGEEGEPAAPSPAPGTILDAGSPPDADATLPPPPNVAFDGVVRADDGGLGGALVIIEMGGLDQPNPAGLGPDGAVIATILPDPFIRKGALSGATGTFSFTVPAGAIGVRVLYPGFLELTQRIETVTSPDAAPTPTLLALQTSGEGGAGAPPLILGLHATPSLVAPGVGVSFALNAMAGSSDDPLSEDVLLVAPSLGWAGALAPQNAAVPGGAYPDGTYNRVVSAPTVPGLYTFTGVVASLHRQTSLLASITLTVTANGDAPVPDAAFYDGEVFPDVLGGDPGH